MTEAEPKTQDDQTSNVRSATLLLAWQCLQHDEFAGKTMVQKAEWLMKMGLSRAEAAVVLGSNDNSLRVMITQAATKAKAAAKSKV